MVGGIKVLHLVTQLDSLLREIINLPKDNELRIVLTNTDQGIRACIYNLPNNEETESYILKNIRLTDTVQIDITLSLEQD